MAQVSGFSFSVAPLKIVKSVQFGLLSPEETKSMSVAKIIHPETIENEKPKPGGLLDPRLGTIDRNFKCQTCNENMTECPGHFGHIELEKPVFHPGLIHKIKKVLECVCHNCGMIKIDLNSPVYQKIRMIQNKKRRFYEVWSLCKGKMVCVDEMEKSQIDSLPLDSSRKTGCGFKQPSYRRVALELRANFKPASNAEDSSVVQVLMTPLKTASLFKLLTNDDCTNLGLSFEFARPEWMIISVLPVPPMPVRPSISMDGVGRGEDDLTHKLSDIIKANNNLAKHELDGSPAHIIQEFENLLQYHVATYMDNDIAGLPQSLQKDGRPLKGIRARLKGKEGRLRGNLMGKRVDFSARTVITGDPNLEIDQVGVPRSIARTLTFPETVTQFNILELQEAVKNGPNTHPGAKYVIRENGDRIDLRYNKRGGDIHLQYGYKVERHLRDDDIVVFNRQPSLHKMSMMGHRVKIMPYSTFRLNLSVTSPYNADFDGDEMNLHVPQSYETKAEIMELCMVPKQILTPAGNRPVMGIVQDTLTAIRKLTLRDTFITKDLMMNLLLWVPNWDGIIPIPAIIRPVPLWTGKQLISMITPKGINMVGYHSSHPDGETGDMSVGDTKVIIRDGELVCGILCKRTVGQSGGGIIHVIMQEHGPEVCKWFFNGCQRVVNNWLQYNGFSIGIGDTISDVKTMTTINKIINEAKDKVTDIINSAQEDKLECQPGLTIRESFEAAVTKELNRARDLAGKQAQISLKDDNNVKQMVVAGSKGSYINVSQMTACVGQQNVEGSRIPFGFRGRTLPHFTKDDFSPESRGFVENSYLRGLTPQEFFFHAMGGREGLIDTAVKTAETGYIQRRLVKALEDVKVAYDGTVRDSLQSVVQFSYGEDGMDGARVEKQKLRLMHMSDSEVEIKYKVDFSRGLPDFAPRCLNERILNELATDLEYQTMIEEEYEQILSDRNVLRNEIFFGTKDNDYPLAVNIHRVISNAQVMFDISKKSICQMNPIDAILGVRELIQTLHIVRGADSLSVNAQNNATLLFQILLRSTFASKRIVEEFRLSKPAFDHIMGEIKSRFDAAIVAPGEMVGTIAAQSIGEPATQMTLNTFHLAGVGKNVTLGVPRLKEIINVSTNIKTPRLTVNLTPEYRSSITMAKKIQSTLEHTTLKRLTSTTEIWYDPNPLESIIKEDREIYQNYFDMEENEDFGKYSPWVLRIQLDFRRKLDKGLAMESICARIMEEFEGDLKCWHSDDNANNLLILVRIVGDEKSVEEEGSRMEEDVFLKRIEQNILNDITLCGIKNISRAFISEEKRVSIDERTGSYQDSMGWFLETDGVNLLEVLAFHGVDSTRTVSNSMLETLKVLGIEAARAAVVQEIRNVVNSSGGYVNYRHLALLCDIMTFKGHLMAITRHGINRTEAGVLGRSSFEETVELLIEAAGQGESDDCRGVSENIILGQVANFGTGSFGLLLDEIKLQEVQQTHMRNDSFGAGSMSPSHSPYHDRMGSPYNSNEGGYSPSSNVAFSPYGNSGAFTPKPFSSGFSPSS